MSFSTLRPVALLAAAAAEEETYSPREFLSGAWLIGIVALVLLILLIAWLIRKL